MRTLLPFTLLVLAAAPADAAVLKVPKQYPTIQSAINAAASGDVVEVSKGTYHEHVQVSSRTDLTLRAKAGEKVVLDGDGVAQPVILVAHSHDITVQRLRLRNVVGAPAVYFFNSTGLRWLDCRVSAATAGILASALEAAEIRGGKLSGITEDGIEVDGGGRGCVLAENELLDIGGDGIVLAGTQHLVEGNTFLGVGGTAVALGDVVASVSHTIVRGNEMKEVDHGLAFTGNGHHDCALIDNVVRKPTGHGIYLRGDRHLVERNRILGSDAIGISLVIGADARVVDNVVKKAYIGLNIESGVTGASLVGNRVTKCDTYGFLVYGSGHVVFENVAKGSALSDCYDASTDAVFLANDFGTIQP